MRRLCCAPPRAGSGSRGQRSRRLGDERGSEATARRARSNTPARGSAEACPTRTPRAVGFGPRGGRPSLGISKSLRTVSPRERPAVSSRSSCVQNSLDRLPLRMPGFLPSRRGLHLARGRSLRTMPSPDRSTSLSIGARSIRVTNSARSLRLTAVSRSSRFPRKSLAVDRLETPRPQ